MKSEFQIANRVIFYFTMPVISSNMYLIPMGSKCLVIDPCVSQDAEEIFRTQDAKDCLVLLTHEHYDHISGVNWLRERTRCQVVCSKLCAKRIPDPKKNHSAFFTSLFLDRDERTQAYLAEIVDPQYSCRADITYVGRLEFQWNGLKIEMVEAPGHSPGSQIIRVDETNFFTGDYLIPGEKVITRLPGGSRSRYETITRPYLEAIDQTSHIFPGHGTPGVLSEILEKTSL